MRCKESADRVSPFATPRPAPWGIAEPNAKKGIWLFGEDGLGQRALGAWAEPSDAGEDWAGLAISTQYTPVMTHMMDSLCPMSTHDASSAPMMHRE